MRRPNKKIAGEAQRVRLRERLVNEAQKKINQGASLENIVVLLHDRGLSIVESIWVLKHVCDLSISQLKNLVTMHPVWESVVQATEPLHDELEKVASKPLTQRKNRAKLPR